MAFLLKLIEIVKSIKRLFLSIQDSVQPCVWEIKRNHIYIYIVYIYITYIYSIYIIYMYTHNLVQFLCWVVTLARCHEHPFKGLSGVNFLGLWLDTEEGP